MAHQPRRGHPGEGHQRRQHPSPDETGDEPYFSPSQTDDGNIIIAVRNQLQNNGFRQGYLWIMNREGG